MENAYSDLIAAANAVRLNSYSPYSTFKVGAALLGRSGTVYTGTNVENASFGLSICAERAAICQAVASGEQTFTAIAICADGIEPTTPCGACRQVLLEFGANLRVLLSGRDGADGEVLDFQLAELLAHPFSSFTTDDGDSATGTVD